MWENSSASTSKIAISVVAVMSFSALAYATLRRGVLRRAGTRAFSSGGTATATAAACSDTCTCCTIDPIVKEENCIEKTLPPEIKALHAQAVANGESTYTDPKTGFTVFTRLGQMEKKQCCGCRCRHCPYGHINVKAPDEKCNRGFPKSMDRYVEVYAKRTMSTTPPLAAAAAPGGEKAADSKPAEAKSAGGAAPKHSVVYTKTGDKGTSALFTGERRKKTDPVFEALGALDELSSHVGLARAMLRSAPEKREHDGEMMDMLEAIQQELLNAGTVVATPTGKNAEDETAKRMTDILEGYRFLEKTAAMEKTIDVIDSRLVPLRIFILPGGGNVSSAQLHVCRTTCRRAERRMIEVRDLYGEGYSDHLRQATVYVNRLSDFLFVAARSIAEEDIVRKYD